MQHIYPFQHFICKYIIHLPSDVGSIRVFERLLWLLLLIVYFNTKVQVVVISSGFTGQLLYMTSTTEVDIRATKLPCLGSQSVKGVVKLTKYS